MRLEFVYPATLTPASDHAPGETGFVVSFRDLPEAITQGETIEEALCEAADCLEEAISNRTRRKMDIPSPSPVAEGEHPVSVGASVALKAALAVAMREATVSNVSLAATLGKDEKEIRRLLDPGHSSKLSAMEDALRPLGKRVRVIVEDMAPYV
jgi:antitoxin HicB